MWNMEEQIKHPYLILPHYIIKGHFYINGMMGQIVTQIRKSNLVIVTQYASLSTQLAMYLSSVFGKKWIFWSESIEGVAYEKRPLVQNEWLASKLRSVAIYPIKRWATECWAIGNKAVDSMRMKMPDKKICKYFYYSDLSEFINSRPPTRVGFTKFAFLGSASYRKGFDLLIAAVEILRLKKANDFVIEVYGDGPLLQSVTKDISRYFVLHGFIDHDALIREMSQCNALVFPSRYDGWGLAVIEALAMGLYTIVSFGAGAKEAIMDGLNGHVLQENTAVELAESMEFYMANKQRLSDVQIIKGTAKPFTLEQGVSDFQNLLGDL